MPRRKSLTGQLYRAARTSNNLRAASRGPVALAKRQVRRKAYGGTARTTGRLLRWLGVK